jgi:cytochrome c peroxidase
MRIDRTLSALGETKLGGSMNKSDWVRASCRVALFGIAMTACSACSIAAELLTAPHGALPMPQQQQRLDELVSGLGSPPPGIDPTAWTTIYVPVGNELSPDRIALGRKLYFDARLSKDGTVACATCHDVSRGFTDRRSVSEGIGDHLGKRSAPTTMNATLLQSQSKKTGYVPRLCGA